MPSWIPSGCADAHHLPPDVGQTDTIEVEVDDRDLTVGFEGRWLVEPDPDTTNGTRTTLPGYGAGADWGVALTKRGRIAVYMAQCNEGFPAQLTDYDTLDEAAENVPDDIMAEAAGAMGQKMVITRDI